ncbi:hypothetical protein MT418_006501 [Batrachochytrium dendrobatidis]
MQIQNVKIKNITKQNKKLFVVDDKKDRHPILQLLVTDLDDIPKDYYKKLKDGGLSRHPQHLTRSRTELSNEKQHLLPINVIHTISNK